YQGLREKGVTIPGLFLTTAKGLIVVFNILCLVIFVLYADRFLFDSKVFLSKLHEISKEKKVIVYYKDVNNSPYILPKATIPKDLYPEYMRDSNVSERQLHVLRNFGTSNKDTMRLVATNQYEFEYQNTPEKGKIIARTLLDVPWPQRSWLLQTIGIEAYNGIAENTYYLMEFYDQ
ncbi:MAG: hypothetical protein JWO03_3520, partial [Bacteroidetes bacterium]|nr:hypothetical protein [Bacteroidota bacterium]